LVLPGVGRYLLADADTAAPVITASAGGPAGLRYSWSPSPPASPLADGWVVDLDGTPLHPIPGWRGLLFGHPLDLNTATAEDLEALPGIGPQTAGRVLADRAARGPFAEVQELERVRGIGPRTVARLRPLVTTSAGNHAR
jgi:competence protein ComEA